MCNEKNQNSSNCIAEILRIIVTLQDNAVGNNIDSCDKPALGGSSCSMTCNTRPITLYLCGANGTPLSIPVNRANTGCDAVAPVTSCVFRCEKVDGNCATCRVLAPNPDTTSVQPFVATDSIFTVDLSCCCIIRCLNDTFVECV